MDPKLTRINREIGRSPPRLEGREKVTGRAEYTHHLKLPDMLYGKIFRSTVAHGRIRSIDVSAARAVEGVHSVVTGQDILSIVPDPYYGPAFLDQPVLAQEKVRYIGEPVAVVLAADPHVADMAMQKIEVEYDELPAVFDQIEALTSEAIVHDVLKPSEIFADLRHLVGRKKTNVAVDFHLKHGDPARGFEMADKVFEHTFRTQQTMHTPLEPIVSLAVAGDRRLTIYTASQMPSVIRQQIARLLGWEQNQVRVKVAHVGGGFGAKTYIKLEALVAVLALLVRRPVKIALTMEEQFVTITRHATTFRIKSGVTKDGRIVARRCDVWWNGGAYADVGPRVAQKSGFAAAGPYDIENIAIASYEIYTNRPPAGAMRGYGIPQLVWAYESHTDILAHELGIDPIEFRRRNILREGQQQATGAIMHDTEIERVLERLAQRLEWNKPFDRGTGTIRRGRGIAIGFKAVISSTTSTATIMVNADGNCMLIIGTVDIGQGSDTAMAQIVAEVMRIPLESVRVVRPDTDVTPYDMGTIGSRSTFHMGHAVRLAAEDARTKLHTLAREANLLVDRASPSEIFRARYGMQAGSVVGFGSYIPNYAPTNSAEGYSSNTPPFWMVGGTGIEVEVDTETGHVRIVRMINVADAGVALNPRIAETQLSGGAIMQLGSTMTEKMEFDAGQVTNASLADYKIPGFHDIPIAIENEIIEAEQHDGPFGAKGVGESGTFSVSPAAANAIYDAVGVRIFELPITPESVYRAIRSHQNEPLED